MVALYINSFNVSALWRMGVTKHSSEPLKFGFSFVLVTQDETFFKGI